MSLCSPPPSPGPVCCRPGRGVGVPLPLQGFAVKFQTEFGFLPLSLSACNPVGSVGLLVRAAEQLCGQALTWLPLRRAVAPAGVLGVG